MTEEPNEGEMVSLRTSRAVFYTKKKATVFWLLSREQVEALGGGLYERISRRRNVRGKTETCSALRVIKRQWLARRSEEGEDKERKNNLAGGRPVRAASRTRDLEGRRRDRSSPCGFGDDAMWGEDS